MKLQELQEILFTNATNKIENYPKIIKLKQDSTQRLFTLIAKQNQMSKRSKKIRRWVRFSVDVANFT